MKKPQRPGASSERIMGSVSTELTYKMNWRTKTIQSGTEGVSLFHKGIFAYSFGASKVEGYPTVSMFTFAGELVDRFSSVIAHNVIWNNYQNTGSLVTTHSSPHIYKVQIQ